MPKTVGIFVRDEFINAGDKGLIVADLFKKFRQEDKTNATYSSFWRYVNNYRLLGFIEPTGKTKRARRIAGKRVLKDKKFYRITEDGGINDTKHLRSWSNPITALYPQFGSEWKKEYLIKWRQRRALLPSNRGRPRFQSLSALSS